MNIVHITETNNAYAPARFVHLTNRYTKHRAFLFQEKSFLFGNPLCIVPVSDELKIREALEDADILHFHGSPLFDKKIYKGIDLTPFMSRKKVVLHYHGTPQREGFMKFQRQKLVSKLIVSTPEMLPLFPVSIWFPNLIDENEQVFKDSLPKTPQGKISIVHHFSFHKAMKDSDVFFEASEAMKKNRRFDFVFVNRCDIQEALQKRAESHVVFDHLQGYYGFVSIEGMSLGVAVVNGCNESVSRCLVEFFGSMPPFIIANRDNFQSVIEKMTPESVFSTGMAGKKFIADKWSGKKCINKLVEIYEGVLNA